MSAPTPGWYAEPDGSGGERWWDGQQWTGHRRPNGSPERHGQAGDIGSPRASAPGGAMAPGSYPLGGGYPPIQRPPSVTAAVVVAFLIAAAQALLAWKYLNLMAEGRGRLFVLGQFFVCVITGVLMLSGGSAALTGRS